MAMYNLGIIYKNGASWHCAGRVRVDRTKARRLLERALALGLNDARDALREMDEDVPNCGIVAKVVLFLACWVLCGELFLAALPYVVRRGRPEPALVAGEPANAGASSAPALLSDGVDLVLGHAAHQKEEHVARRRVVRPVEERRVFGLGRFLRPSSAATGAL